MSYNAPKYEQGNLIPGSKKRLPGSWYVYHDGKRHRLTKYGCTRESVKVGSKQYHAEVLPAYEQWKKEIQESEYRQRVESVQAENKVVTVADVCNNYLLRKLGKQCWRCKAWLTYEVTTCPHCNLTGLPNTVAPYKINATRHLFNLCQAKDSGKIWTGPNRIHPKHALGQDGVKYAILPYEGWGNLPAEEVSHATLQEFIACHPNWSASGIRGAITPIKAAFAFAATQQGGNLIPDSKIKDFELEPTPARRDYFSEDDETAFKKAIDRECFKIFFDALISTGARPGELATLTDTHVYKTGKRCPDCGEWIVTDSTTCHGCGKEGLPRFGYYWELSHEEWKCGKKTKKSRKIYLSHKWILWTEQRLAEIEEGGFLFLSPQGRKWDRKMWERQFDRAKEKSGINPRLVPYSTRHTFITRALVRGWSAGKVAAFCGTSEEEIRKHYGHLVDEGAEMSALAESCT